MTAAYPPPSSPEFQGSSTPQGPQPPQGPVQPRMVPVQFPTVTPLVTYAILTLTVLVFLAQLGSESVWGVDLPGELGVKDNSLIVSGQLWRLFTPMLLHGSILHIAFNMYALYIIGGRLERFYGHFRLLVLYVLAGFAGNVASFIFTPAPSLGSSTAIFGLLGAEGVLLYRNRQLFGGMARQALSNIITIAAINLLLGLSPGIDNWGHVGGLVGGTLFAWFAGPLLRVEGLYPALTLADERETREAVLAGAGVGAIFAFLAAMVIVMRGG